MKKVKITFWIIMIILLVVLVWQNWPSYFSTKHQFSIDLIVVQRTSPEVNNLIIIAVFFAAGMLIAYISSLFERFKANKTIKELRSGAKADQETINQMRREVDALKASFGSRPATPVSDASDRSMAAAEQIQPPQS